MGPIHSDVGVFISVVDVNRWFIIREMCGRAKISEEEIDAKGILDFCFGVQELVSV